MATIPSVPTKFNRSARRARYVVLLCSVALALVAAVWFTARLQADDNSPAALGGIAGTVKDTNGQPVGGAQITLFTKVPYNSWYEQRRVTTEADGIYRFTALSPGVYRVGMDRPQANFAPRYYPDISVLQQASDIPVAGNQVTGIDLTLQPAGRIVVAITATQALSITNSYVDLRQRIETAAGVRWDYVPYLTLQQASNGVYTITGLAANTYRVCAAGYSPTSSAYECYDNVYSVEKATDLALGVGATISNVAIVLGDGANYGQINGHVTANNGAPLANIKVYAVPVMEESVVVAAAERIQGNIARSWSQSPTTQQAVSDLYYGYTFTYTNALGDYQLPTLIAGKYRLQFTDPAGAYAYEYYNNVIFESGATIFEVSDQQVITAVNIALDPGGRISGNVTLQGQPAPNGQVLAERKVAEDSWVAVAGAIINPNTGGYVLGGLPAGSYRISAQAWIYDQQYYFQPYGVYGGATLAEAIEIPVAAGSSAPNINITLSSPRFEGSLSGRVTAQGAPLAGAQVKLLRSDTCCYFPVQVPFVYVLTDATGRYTINGLTDSSFRIGVTDPTGIYATTYYTDKAILEQSTPLSIQDGQAITELNFDLPLAGAISGVVQRRDGKPVAGLFIFLYLLNPQYNYFTQLGVDNQTDAQGHYTIGGLHAGDYQICFSDVIYGNRIECYGGIDSFYGSYSPRVVKVTAGQTSANIDLIWGPDLRSYLPFVAQ